MTAPKAAHTPGNWEVGPLANREDGNGNDERVIQLYDGGPTIATAWPMGEDFNGLSSPTTERDANARLIAAAPELFEHLKTIYFLQGFLPGNPPLRQAIGALLARIDGTA